MCVPVTRVCLCVLAPPACFRVDDRSCVAVCSLWVAGSGPVVPARACSKSVLQHVSVCCVWIWWHAVLRVELVSARVRVHAVCGCARAYLCPCAYACLCVTSVAQSKVDVPAPRLYARGKETLFTMDKVRPPPCARRWCRGRACWQMRCCVSIADSPAVILLLFRARAATSASVCGCGWVWVGGQVCRRVGGWVGVRLPLHLSRTAPARRCPNPARATPYPLRRGTRGTCAHPVRPRARPAPHAPSARCQMRRAAPSGVAATVLGHGAAPGAPPVLAPARSCFTDTSCAQAPPTGRRAGQWRC